MLHSSKQRWRRLSLHMFLRKEHRLKCNLEYRGRDTTSTMVKNIFKYYMYNALLLKSSINNAHATRQNSLLVTDLKKFHLVLFSKHCSVFIICSPDSLQVTEVTKYCVLEITGHYDKVLTLYCTALPSGNTKFYIWRREALFWHVAITAHGLRKR